MKRRKKRKNGYSVRERTINGEQRKVTVNEYRKRKTQRQRNRQLNVNREREKQTYSQTDTRMEEGKGRIKRKNGKERV
jgi:hypothetical protein